MTPEITAKLYQAFPALYRGKDKPLQESCMSRGFECEDGWFDLIWNLSQAIEESAQASGLSPTHSNWPEAFQVKQKFGRLRMHVLHKTDEMSILIDAASEASQSICEICGATPAHSVVINRWVQTLCSECQTPTHA